LTWPAEPSSPTTEEMKMIRPRRRRSMPLAARLASRNEPVRLVSMTEDQSSSDIRRTSVSAVMPAFATRTSTGPCAASISTNAASTAAGSVTSQRTSRVPSGAPPLRVVTATWSPFATNASAIARPMPLLPPVTRTDLLTPATLAITPG
jgi:Flp pilus assembly protein TadG